MQPASVARSVRNYWQSSPGFEEKGVALRVMSMASSQPLDTGTATGRLMLAVIGAVEQAEHEAMLERQREGIAKAKRKAAFEAVCRPSGVRLMRSFGFGRRCQAVGNRQQAGDWTSERVQGFGRVGCRGSARGGMMSIPKSLDDNACMAIQGWQQAPPSVVGIITL
jgi:hypothetical protein